MFRRFFCAVLIISFLSTSILPGQGVWANQFLGLPEPGSMLTPSAAFTPVMLKGLTIDLEDPLHFDFIIDKGDSNLKIEQLKNESTKLIKYFLTALTIPKKDLWVNLSPYEKNRIVPDALGKTQLGQDLLSQDYVLKQFTASMIYPEKELGREFWNRVRQEVKEKFGTTDIPVATFNKVWILPDTAVVYEHDNTVYVTHSHLKVMLDEDYLATQKNNVSMPKSSKGESLKVIIRQIILPAIEREVNEGAYFAPMRQIYNSLILAKWYKEAVTSSLLSKVYFDQKKIMGVHINDPAMKDKIYARYVQAFKKGVYNYIKEDYDQTSGQMTARKYFSGGTELNLDLIPMQRTHDREAAVGLPGHLFRASVEGRLQIKKDKAMLPQLAVSFKEQEELNLDGVQINSNIITPTAITHRTDVCEGQTCITILPTNIAVDLTIKADSQTFIFLPGDLDALKNKRNALRNAETDLQEMQFTQNSGHSTLGIGGVVPAEIETPYVEGVDRGLKELNQTRDFLTIVNTSKAETVEDAIILAGVGVYNMKTPLIKIEIRDKDLWAKNDETIEAVMRLVELNPGLKILPLIGKKISRTDLERLLGIKQVVALRIEATQPGTNNGLGTPEQQVEIKQVVKWAREIRPGIPLIAECGLGYPADVKKAMGPEFRFNGVLVNAAITESKDPVKTALGFIEGVRAGKREKEQSDRKSHDNAMAIAAPDKVGGIDMNNIKIDRNGMQKVIHYDPAQVQKIVAQGIDGVEPVIIRITPILKESSI